MSCQENYLVRPLYRIRIIMDSVRFLFTCLLLCGGHSDAASDLWWCRNGIFADDQDNLRLATAAGHPQTRFCSGMPEAGPPCPTESKDGLRPGDQVLASKVQGGWACVYKNLDTVGWVREADLEFTAFDRQPPLQAWVGSWRDGENRITIALAPGGKALRARGSAIWRSRVTVHTGSLEAQAQPELNHILFREGGQGECTVRMTLVGARLAVSDNRACGGMNVSFTGVYGRSASPSQRKR